MAIHHEELDRTVEHRRHDHKVGGNSIDDIRFRPGQTKPRAVTAGDHRGAGIVAVLVRDRQRKLALSGHNPAQQLRFLFVRTRLEDRPRPGERTEEWRGSQRPAHLADDHGEIDIAHPKSAIRLRDDERRPSKFGDLRP